MEYDPVPVLFLRKQITENRLIIPESTSYAGSFHNLLSTGKGS